MADKRSSTSSPPPRTSGASDATVDLGLSGLLSDAASSAPEGRSPEDKAQPPVTPAQPPATQKETEYVPLQLMAAGKWLELAAWCEQGLSPKLRSSGPEEAWPRIERRVWWIRSQERLQGVPLSILAAPLEEVSHEFLAHRESGSVTLGPAIFESLQNELHKLLGELAKGLKSRGDESTAARLEDLRKRVGTASPATSQQASTAPATHGREQSETESRPEPMPRIRAELTERLTSDLPARELKPAARGRAPRSDGTNAGAMGKDRAISSAGRWWLKALVFTVVILVLVGGLLLQRLDLGSLRDNLASLGADDTHALKPQVPLPDGLKEPALQPPSLPEPQPPSQLEAILEDYRSARVLAPQTEARPQAPAQNASASASVGGDLPVVSSAASAVARQPVPQQKETVNTAGPLEPPHFPRGRDRLRDRPSDSPRGPRDPSAPRTQDAPRTLPERPAFENFKTPRVYRTLVETDVMSAPTIRGRALDVLPAGVEILVEGKEGYWLRIRSQRGNRGFILSQDAVRVPSP